MLRTSWPESGIATAIGVVVLLLGASTVFAELQTDIDRIWHVPAKAKPAGIWGMIRIGCCPSAIMGSLCSSCRWWRRAVGAREMVGPYFAWTIVPILTSVSFAAYRDILPIYKTLPSTPVRWREMWIGAAVTALLFTVGKFLIGLYLGKSDVASGFGAAGSLVLVMIWVYYSAQIFLLGAEFTRVHSRTAASRQAEPSRPEGAAATNEIPAWGKPAANEPSQGRTPAQQLLVARRSVSSAGEVVIHDGRVLIDPVGRGAVRQSCRLKAYAARRAGSRNRSLPAMSIAAIAGLLFGVLYKVKSVPGQPIAWRTQLGHK
jgi:membrane protein